MSVAIALTVAEGAAGSALAAAPLPSASLPPGAPTPGQVQSNLPTAPQAPSPKAAPLVSTPPPGPAPVAAGGPSVTVTRFVIIGNSAFPDAVLQQQVAGYLGQALTLADLYKVADVLTRFYQSHGYGLTRATLPEQELTGGNVTLQVVEGRIGKLSVEGAHRTRESVIAHQASALAAGDVYTDAAMDRSILLVNDLPGIQAQVVLQPGEAFGTADAVYKVDEGPAYSGQLSVDDYGRPDVGRVRFNGEVSVLSPTGSGDRLTADVTHTEHNQLNFGALSYSLPLGPPGGRLNASYNQSRYYVTGAFSLLNLSGTSKNANLAYQYPQLRSRESSFYWGVGFEHESGSSSVNPVDPTTHKPLGATRVSDSNLNLLQLTAFYTASHEDGSSGSLSGSFSSNGHHDDGNDPRAQRAKLELDGNYLQPLNPSWTFIAKGASAWSPDPLSDTEKFSLGGPDNVRGYPSADVRGDAGFFGSLELQHSFAPDLPIAVGGFFDAGRVWSRHFDTPTAAGVSTTPPSVETLESVGADLVFQSSDKRWEARLEWAYAVGYAKPSDGNGGGHLWATFGMNF